MKQKLDEKKMLHELLERCEKKKDVDLVKKAFNYSIKMHEGQKRASGDPYFIHPFETAVTLANWGMDNNTIAAGLLHDIIEDTSCDSKELIKSFGPEICQLVVGTTQTDTTLSSKEAIKTKALKKTLLASIENINSIIIKLADKKHNLKTLEFLPEKRRRQIAKSALEIYSPLAQKFGMNELKYDIERMCFPHAMPKEFMKIHRHVKKNLPKRELQMKKAIEILTPVLGKTAVKYEKFYKPEFILYNKFLKKKEVKSIIDCIVLVIVVKKIEDCYKTMGLIHKTFKPVPGKIKDFIAIPKNDFYSAIHTTVIGPYGRPMKIYIKSKEMYDIAKHGILYYLRSKEKHDKFLKPKLEWVQKIKKTEPITSKQLASLLGINSISENTFVFDSKGNLIELPQNSTAIDYYFFRHEEKVPYLKKVKINKKNARFNSVLTAGDIIEGEYSKKPTINQRWLLLTQNIETCRKIKKALKKFSKKQNAKFYFIITKIKNIPGMLSKLTSIMAKYNINIEEIYQEEIDIESGKNMYVYLTVKTPDKNILEDAIKELKQEKGVNAVKKKSI